MRSVLRSFLSIGVPVNPRKQAFGSAWRMLAARLLYWVRWASSTITKMLWASERVGWTDRSRGVLAAVISWNFWIVVITVLPVGCSRIRRRSRTLSARSGFGKPQAFEDAGDLAVQLRAVGDDDDGRLLLGGVAAEFEREPEHGQASCRKPWVCQTTPPRSLGLRAVRILCIASFTAMKLPVPGQLADGAAALDLEDDEVPDDVEEVLPVEQSVEEGVLGLRRSSEFVFELVGG